MPFWIIGVTEIPGAGLSRSALATAGLSVDAENEMTMPASLVEWDCVGVCSTIQVAGMVFQRKSVGIKNLLQSVWWLGYDFLVTAKSVTGFDSPNSRRTHRQLFSGGFFVSGAWRCSLGRAVRGALRLAGAYCRSVNPHGSVLFAFDSARTGKFPTSVGAAL